MTKTKDNIEKYVVALPKKKRVLDVRDYITPTGWKKKRNISGSIDKILYAAQKNKSTGQVFFLKPKPQPEPDIRDYIIPMKKKRKTRWSERVDETLYGKK